MTGLNTVIVSSDPQPAEDWAKETADAINASSTVHSQVPYSSAVSEGQTMSELPKPGSIQQNGSPSTSTPRLELPGAFSHYYSETGTRDGVINRPLVRRTPTAALEHLADAAPPKELSVSEIGHSVRENVRGVVEKLGTYVPNVTVGYLPEIGVMSTSPFAKETPIENELDVTTPSKPASLVVVEQHIPSGLVSPKDSITLDAASTKAIPPSTRHGSFMTETPSESSTQTPNTTYPLDGTSTAKPASQATRIDYPTPPSSLQTSSDSQERDTPYQTLASSVSTPVTEQNVLPRSQEGLSPSRHPDTILDNLTPTSTPTTSPVTNSNTLPDPEKADSTVCPGVNTVPTQDHVKSGVGASIGRLEAPNNNMPATQKAEQGLQRAHGSSVSDEVGGAPASYKREGRVRGLVHKVKDKLTHRGH